MSLITKLICAIKGHKLNFIEWETVDLKHYQTWQICKCGKRKV